MCVAVAGFLGASMVLGPGEEDAPALSAESAEEPDAFVEGGIITQWGEAGRLRYRLHAERISHFEAAGRSTLQAPVVELHDAQGPPWHIKSKTGEVRTFAGASGTEEQIELYGEVALTQDRGDGAYTRIHTESLTMVPARGRAGTTQTAMIETETFRVRAGGFDADLANGRLAFASSVDQRVSIVVQPHQQTDKLR